MGSNGLVRKLFFILLCWSFIEALFEFSNTSTSIENSLLAGIERMTFGTYFNENCSAWDCRAGSKNFSATTGNFCITVVRMNFGSHFSPSYFAGSCGLPHVNQQWVKITTRFIGPKPRLLCLGSRSNYGLLNLHEEFSVGFGPFHLLKEKLKSLL